MRSNFINIPIANTFDILGENLYAKNLKEQGVSLVRVGVIDWLDYNGCMIPAFLPHCVPFIDPDSVGEALHLSGRLMVRWITGFGQLSQSEWWYILRKDPWNIEQVEDKKKRWMIRQGRKNFNVRPLTEAEILKYCALVAQLAASRYKGDSRVETQADFEKKVRAIQKYPGVAEYIGCFHEDQLVSFSENFIQDNAVFLSVIRHDPAFLNKYSGYALIDWMLTEYLNERKFKYVLDGSRSIYHSTNIQDHLINVFGFTREYAKLNLVYAPWFGMLIKLLFPARRLVSKWSEIRNSRVSNKLAALLRQEDIVRSCRKARGEANKDDALVTPAGVQKEVAIIPLSNRLVPQIARLHIEGIKDSFLGSLGEAFVQQLYRGIIFSDTAFGYAAIKGGDVIGFISCAGDVKSIFKYVMKKKFFLLLYAFLPKMGKWKNIKNAFETLFYPTKSSLGLPAAEILSVVVDEKARGLGVGKMLMEIALAEFQRRGINEVKVMVGEKLPANEYYKKLGFEVKGQYEHHGYRLNTYTRKTG
jgi:ribosomal protein S18 acetylase RimI-like enzyme